MAKLPFRKLDEGAPLFWGLIAPHIALLAPGLGAALMLLVALALRLMPFLPAGPERQIATRT